MRRFGTLAIVWIALFAGTLGVRAFMARGDARTSQPNDEIEMRQALDELVSKPRKNALASMQQASQDPVFEAALTDSMLKNADGLKSCRQRIIHKLARASEYFEVSFVPRILEEDGQQRPGSSKKVRLSEVALERATVDLSHDEEDCIVEQFKKLEVNAVSVPNERSVEVFCFKGGGGARTQ